MAIEFDTLSDAQIAMEVITRDNAENIKDGAGRIAPIHSRLKSVTVHDIIMTQQGDKQIPRPKQKTFPQASNGPVIPRIHHQTRPTDAFAAFNVTPFTHNHRRL